MDVNVCLLNGMILLMMVLCYGVFELVLVLLKVGVDVLLKNE